MLIAVFGNLNAKPWFNVFRKECELEQPLKIRRCSLVLIGHSLIIVTTPTAVSACYLM